MSRRAARDFLDNAPEILPSQRIARVVESRGNSTFRVEFTDASSTLARLPPKFRNTVWVKRGSFVVTEALDNSGPDAKLAASIVAILSASQIRELCKGGHWPAEFMPATSLSTEEADSVEEESASASASAAEDECESSPEPAPTMDA